MSDEERQAAERKDEERRAMVESTHYPVYRGYERTAFIRAIDEWIVKLHTLHTEYNEEFHRQFGISVRHKLCQYRKLIRRMKRLVQGLRDLATLLRTATYESEMPSECPWLQLVLDVWIKRAIRQFELVTMKDASEYVPPKQRRDKMESMKDDVGDLATGLKNGPLERLAGILEVLCADRQDGMVYSDRLLHRSLRFSISCWKRRCWSRVQSSLGCE